MLRIAIEESDSLSVTGQINLLERAKVKFRRRLPSYEATESQYHLQLTIRSKIYSTEHAHALPEGA
jgi:hypothetical protein